MHKLLAKQKELSMGNGGEYMKTMYGYRMLARARGKYGRPNYPGRHGKDKNMLDTKIETIELDEKQDGEKINIEHRENTQEVWRAIKDILRNEMSPVAFETWISPCSIVSIIDDKIVLEVENIFIMDVVKKRFLKFLVSAAECILLKSPVKAELVVQEN